MNTLLMTVAPMKTDTRLTFAETVDTTKYSLDTLQQEMIRCSFFLPADLLQAASQDWEIQPIKFCTHSEWVKAQQYMLDYGAVIKYENGSKMLVMAAKTVAVSVRRHRSLNEWIVLTKLWCGDIGVNDFFHPTSSLPPVRSPQGMSHRARVAASKTQASTNVKKD